MKRFILRFLILAVYVVDCMIGMAFAADLKPAAAPVYVKAAPPMSYNWSGLYLSGELSYAANFGGMATSALGATTDLSSIPHGFGAGAGVRLLYQGAASPWVLGTEADLSWMNLQAGGSIGAGGVTAIAVNNATNWLGDANLVVGYTLEPQLMAYLSGGFAFGGAKPNLQVMSVQQAASDTSVGYDIKGGLDWAATQALNVFVEGGYSHLGGQSLSIGAPPNVIATSSAQYDIIKETLGLRFKIWQPGG